MKYILYKKPIELDTLYIVQYAYSEGKDIRPKCCVERNWCVDPLPSIFDLENDKWYYGLEKVIHFYEKKTGIKDIHKLALNFKEENPNYRIGDT